MKINIKPAAYLLAGVGGPDFLSKNRDIAQSYCASPAYANAVDPLHLESLVIELAEALQNLKCELVLSDVPPEYIESHFRTAINKAEVVIAKVNGDRLGELAAYERISKAAGGSAK